MYPGSGSFALLSFNVIVSPTLISDKLLILAAIYPTSPASSSLHGAYVPGSKCPTSVTVKVLLFDISIISSPTFTFPSFTLTYAIAPLYSLYIESKIKHFNGAFSSPVGAGKSVTILSNTSSTLSPVFADIHGASCAGIPIMSSISCFTSSGLAFGRSTLFITGKISRLLSIAKYTFASV